MEDGNGYIYQSVLLMFVIRLGLGTRYPLFTRIMSSLQDRFGKDNVNVVVAPRACNASRMGILYLGEWDYGDGGWGRCGLFRLLDDFGWVRLF